MKVKLSIFIIVKFNLKNKLFMLNRFLAMILLLTAGSAYAQDPEFTQFYANPLYLNPAFAGSSHCPRMNLNYRNQWPALQGLCDLQRIV